MLSPTDYQITEAEDGEQALAAVAKQPADLILMEIQMPILDGYEATRQIRTDPSLRAIPIIAVTSYAPSGADEEPGRRAATIMCLSRTAPSASCENSPVPALSWKSVAAVHPLLAHRVRYCARASCRLSGYCGHRAKRGTKRIGSEWTQSGPWPRLPFAVLAQRSRHCPSGVLVCSGRRDFKGKVDMRRRDFVAVIGGMAASWPTCRARPAGDNAAGRGPHRHD